MWLGLSKCWLLHEIIVQPLLQLGGFVEKYAGTGMTLHPQSCSNKENRRTQGLNHYLQTLQSNRTAPGRTVSWQSYQFINSNYLIILLQNLERVIEQFLFFVSFGFHICSVSSWPAGVIRGREGAGCLSHDAGGGFLHGSHQQQHRW